MKMAAPGRKERREATDSKAAYEKREKRRRIRKLQEAIEQNDVATVQELLHQEFDVDFRYKGQTALQLAVCHGQFEICKLLLERGASVNETDVELNSLLNMACWHGFANISQLLIDSNVNKDLENDKGTTPLHACAKKGHASIAKILLAAGCNPNSPDRFGCTPAYIAARESHVQVMEELVYAGADLDWVDQNYRTPLMVAAEQGDVDMVKILLAGGAQCDKQDRHGNTALLDAAANSQKEVVKVLLRYHANPDIPCTKGSTPLLEAVRSSNLDIAQMLIEAGCNINLSDRLSHAPIHEAIRQAQYFDPAMSSTAVSLVKQLVSKGANLNVADNQGWRPIYQAAYGGNKELTQLLLESGADVTVVTTSGDTVMHGAVYGNNLDIVELFITAGCAVNGVNKAGQTPLMSGIASRSNIRILKSLIEADADLNQPESSGLRTPLHEAIHQHYNKAAILLIDSGCYLTAVNRERQTPLYCASAKGNDEIVAYLLAALPRPLPPTSLSAIPVHAAAKFGHAHTLQLLAEAGSDINQINSDGLTPLQVAAQEDNFPAARRLLQLGCDIDAHAKVTHLLKCCLMNEDRHPHFALEPLFLAMTHRNIELMRLFVDCYSHLPFITIRLLKGCLKTSRELLVHYSGTMKSDLLVLFTETLSQPKRLQDLARRTIRLSLGSLPHRKVTSLPVAEKLKDYILMKDVFEGWDGSDRLDEEIKSTSLVFRRRFLEED
ncbi:ankyrin-1-like isoform X2 [Pomacea canaliculata]|uniref:ankyrin-1-like isoform X2 n=1 Tax=Pomacea canaliculata TaxID=400727 RepID=UPI000D72BF35|nr:ankyrin-1-like isoform X2 [Pomacea canaliculata]